MHTYTTKAIILRSIPYQESDRLIVSFTEDFGKLTLLARGIQKSESRLAPYFIPTFRPSVSFIFGKQFPVVIDAGGNDGTSAAGLSWIRLTHAYALARIIDTILPESGKDEALYFILEASFRLFYNRQYISPHYEYNWSSFLLGRTVLAVTVTLGHKPDLSHCIICRKVSRGSDRVFSISGGGIVHRECVTPSMQTLVLLTPNIKCALENSLCATRIPRTFHKDEARVFRDICCRFLFYMTGKVPDESFFRQLCYT